MAGGAAGREQDRRAAARAAALVHQAGLPAAPAVCAAGAVVAGAAGATASTGGNIDAPGRSRVSASSMPMP